MDKWLELMQQWDGLNWLNIVYSVFVCVCVAVCVTDCACVCVWLWGMARCCFGTCSQENKRLGSLRPHQLPSTRGQWRENQITCDHKHLPNKWNVVIWGCCWKMTDMEGDCRDLSCQNSGQGDIEKKENQKKCERILEKCFRYLLGYTHCDVVGFKCS